MHCLRLLFHERPHRPFLIDMSVVQEIIHLRGFFPTVAALSKVVFVRGRKVPILDLAPVGVHRGPARRLVVVEIDDRLHALPALETCASHAGAGERLDVRALVQAAC